MYTNSRLVNGRVRYSRQVPAATDRTKARRRTLAQKLARIEMARASIEVFEQNELDDVSVEALLQSAGVSRRTFYKYFTDKRDVLATLYEQVVEQLLRAVVDASSGGTDLRSGVRAGIDAYLQYHVDNREILRVVEEEALQSRSPLHPIRKRFREQLAQALSALLQAEVGHQFDELVVLALISGLEGLSLDLLAAPPNAADIERVRAAILGLVDVVLHAPELIPRATHRR